MKIYLDNAATTCLDKRVLKEMLPYFTLKYGNPMSVHQFGQDALNAITLSRQKIADFLHCNKNEIIFTSGATESNNFALRGIILANLGKFIPHVITSEIEHHCVLETLKQLVKEKLIELSIIHPQRNGIVSVQEVIKSIQKNTILVSIMYVNNEIGTIQPIEKIGKTLKKIRPNIYFHTDAVQAINYLNCDINKLHVDLLSFSGHKIYGPKGIGVLYIKKGVKLNKLLYGGDQEFKMRAGTHNVPAIVGLGKAIELVNYKKNKSIQNIKYLHDYFWQQINRKIPQVIINGSPKKRIPSNLNISFKNIEGEGILIALDLEGIAVSTGSACSSGSLEPSHVMMAISNKDYLRSHSSIRFSLGRNTTKKEIDYLLNILPKIVYKLRNISPFKK